MEREPVVRCERLVKVYEAATGKVQVVRGVDLEFDLGWTAVLVGPSGCGKSSPLRMLAGIDHPTAGSVSIDGVDHFSMGSGRRARLRAEFVTYVHLRPSENLIGHLTTAQQLDRVARPRRDRRSKVREVLEMLDLVHRRGHVVADLSGGE